MSLQEVQVLLVDTGDDPHLTTELIRQGLGEGVAEVVQASTIPRALELLAKSRFDILLIDDHLPLKQGLDVIREIRGRRVDTPAILLTEGGNDRVGVESPAADATEYLPKSDLTAANLARTIRRAIKRDRNESLRAAAQRELRRNEKRFRALAENSSDVILLLQEDGRVRYTSRTITRVLGYSVQQYTGRLPSDFLHPEDLAKARDCFSVALKNPGKTLVTQGRVRHRDGTWRFVESMVCNRLQDPSIASIVVNFRDVTDRVRAEHDLRESEAKYREIVDLSPIGIYRSSIEGRFLEANRAFARMLGYESVEEILKLDLPRDLYFDPADRSRLIEENERRGGISELEVLLKKKNGAPLWALLNARSVYDASGKTKYFEGFVHDISGRKLAEESLRNSELRLQEILDSALDAVITIDADGLITDWNRQSETVFGYMREEALGRSLAETIIPPRYREAHTRGLKKFLATGEGPVLNRRVEISALRRDGREFPVELAISPGRSGGTFMFSAFVRDITERKAAERALRQSEENYRALFENNPEPMLVSLGESLQVLGVNHAAIERYGYSRDEFLALTLLDIHCPEDIVLLRSTISASVPGLARSGPLRHRKKDGTIIDVEITSHAIEFAGRKARLALVHDVTERNQAERQIQERTNYLNALIENSPLAIVVLDPEQRVRMVNPAFERLFLYNQRELVGAKLDDFIAPSDPRFISETAEFSRRVLAGETVHATTARRRKDGKALNVELYGVPLIEQGRLLGIYALYQDITERKQLEEQLRVSQKIEAVGRLAGGIAHDFNNLLTAILGYSQIVLGRLPPNDDLRDDVEEIQKAGERAARLTRQLLAFSRKQVLEPEILDLNALLSDLEKMLRRVIGEDIELRTKLDPTLGSVRADPGQLEQVVLNLAVNARDAMPKGGRLVLETQNVELDNSYGFEQVNVQTGPYVMLAVADSGIGMDEAIRSRIFEPFFTTKGPGQGTGLGLATVYGIVKQSGGYVWVYSELNKGTTFKVYLPRHAEIAPPRSLPLPAPAISQPATETILLVEDEEAIRALARKLLQREGYRVIEASGEREATERLRETDEPIGLMLTDVVMPGASGPELASRAVELRPGIKILYMSGYTDRSMAGATSLGPEAPLLQKPFTPETLARKVREVLKRSSE